MADFFEQLEYLMQHAPEVKKQEAYRARLKSLIQEAPSPRPLPTRMNQQAMLLRELCPESYKDDRPNVGLFFYDDLPNFEAQWIRRSKARHKQALFGLWQAAKSEEQILARMAMGSDVYTLNASLHAAEELVYFEELARDFQRAVVYRCQDAEALAKVLCLPEKTAWISLEGEVQEASKLIELLENRTILAQRPVATPHSSIVWLAKLGEFPELDLIESPYSVTNPEKEKPL